MDFYKKPPARQKLARASEQQCCCCYGLVFFSDKNGMKMGISKIKTEAASVRALALSLVANSEKSQSIRQEMFPNFTCQLHVCATHIMATTGGQSGTWK